MVPRQRALFQITRTMASTSRPSSPQPYPKSADELKPKASSSVRNQLRRKASTDSTLAAERSEDWGTRVLKDEQDVFSMNGAFDRLLLLGVV